MQCRNTRGVASGLLPQDQRFEHVARGCKGTGKGSDVIIRFDPYESEDCDYTLPTADHDDILMHELVHAVRDTQGLVNYVPTEDHDYDNVEEYWAIVVT